MREAEFAITSVRGRQHFQRGIRSRLACDACCERDRGKVRRRWLSAQGRIARYEPGTVGARKKIRAGGIAS